MWVMTLSFVVSIIIILILDTYRYYLCLFSSFIGFMGISKCTDSELLFTVGSGG